jgi:hypothetical protein
VRGILGERVEGGLPRREALRLVRAEPISTSTASSP